jgi:uncharacterized membrane protein
VDESLEQRPPQVLRAERLLSFTDGVVAIAATLLVLPLVEVVPHERIDNVGNLLSGNRNTFLAFVLSFLVIYRFWLVHHRIFSGVEKVSVPLVWLNGVWLLAIVFLPFPTQLVGTQDTEDRTAWGLYIGTMLVAAVVSAASHWLISGQRGEETTMRSRARLLVLTGAMAVAFVLAVTVPGAGPWALLLLIPAALGQRVVRGRMESARERSQRALRSRRTR